MYDSLVLMEYVALFIFWKVQPNTNIAIASVAQMQISLEDEVTLT